MKKILMLCGILMFVGLVTSCSKERECRCTSFKSQMIRIIRIDKGECKDLYSVIYDQDRVLYPDIMDSVLCTDFDFESYTE